jgi:hypothetical protein
MPPKKKKKDSTPSGGRKDDGGKVSGADKGKKDMVSKKGGSRKQPPELLIAAASAGSASAVAEPVTPPEAAAAYARVQRQCALREVLRFQQVFKANEKNVDLPHFGDTEEEKSEEEEEDKDDEEYYPFDKGLFEDEKGDILDDDYYHDTEFHGKGASGSKLTPGGPQKPDTTSMCEVEAEKVLKKWRKERKRYTDGVALQKRRELLDDFTFDESTYTGVLSDKIRLMSQVEDSPMKVGHTYPTKEIVLIRIAEEANLSGCMIKIARSCSQRVIASGARDGHTFCIKVLYTNVHSWKVVECITHPEPITVTTTNESYTEVVDLTDAAIVGEEGSPDDDNDNENDDDDPDDDDHEDGHPGE